MNETTLKPNFESGVAGLLPTIAQDHKTGRVLMMAWMNEAAFQETMQTGWACYYSRSRRGLWRKGETSGHRQRLVKVQLDCDADCILLHIEQTGAACHEGYQSCFYRSVDRSMRVSIDEPRLADPETIYGNRASGQD